MKALFDGVIGDILGMARAAFLFFLVQGKSNKNIGDILGMAPAVFFFSLTPTHIHTHTHIHAPAAFLFFLPVKALALHRSLVQVGFSLCWVKALV